MKQHHLSSKPPNETGLLSEAPFFSSPIQQALRSIDESADYMVLTPVAIAAMNFVRRRIRPSAEGYERPAGLTGPALVIGFGRRGNPAESAPREHR